MRENPADFATSRRAAVVIPSRRKIVEDGAHRLVGLGVVVGTASLAVHRGKTNVNHDRRVGRVHEVSGLEVTGSSKQGSAG